MECAIKVSNLDWSFGDIKILKNINVTILKSKFTCIIGPNGCGKTTFLKNMLKILEPKKDTIYICGNDVKRMKYVDLAQKVSAVPQNTTIDFDFSVMDVVLMGRIPHLKRFQCENEKDINIAQKAMKLTNTWHLKDKNINCISGGEKQRVIVARALTQQPQILLLDEPISHLDIYHQIELLNIIRMLCKTKNLTVVAVLHDLNFSIEYADYLILLNNGKIVAEGLPNEVLTVENIKKVYNVDVCMVNNPTTGKPYIIPVG